MRLLIWCGYIASLHKEGCSIGECGACANADGPNRRLFLSVWPSGVMKRDQDARRLNDNPITQNYRMHCEGAAGPAVRVLYAGSTGQRHQVCKEPHRTKRK